MWFLDKMGCVWTMQYITKELNVFLWLQWRFQHQLWCLIVHTTVRFSWYSGENRTATATTRKLWWRDIDPLSMPELFSQWCWLIVADPMMLPPSSILNLISFGQIAVASTDRGSSIMSVLCVSQVFTASPNTFCIFLCVRLCCCRTTKYQVVLHVWQVLLNSSFEDWLKWYLGLDH